MAAYSTGASWSFPQDLPGHWTEAENDPPMESEEHNHQQEHAQLKQEDLPLPPASDNPRPQARRRRRHYPARTCRICLEVVEPTFHYDDSTSLPSAFQSEPRVSYASEEGGRLLRPCKCKGSQKYVHEECLGAWRMADPLQKRNYWECPTCRYRYHLQRLTWSNWISSTAAQIGLTLAIFFVAVFVLGFFADPIINLYLDPVSTVVSAGGPTGSLLYEDEDPGWTEHFFKGLASLGLLGFAKFLFGMGPWHWFNRGTGMVGRSSVGGNGRNRMRELSWIAVAVGIATFLYAVWKGVRAWSRRTLEKAGERVLDVPGDEDDDDE